MATTSSFHGVTHNNVVMVSAHAAQRPPAAALRI